jgi:hypothetical protein
MRTQKLFCILFILFQLVACNFHIKKELPANTEEILLPPLESGIVYYQDQWPLDTLFHLTGEKILDDTLIHEANYIILRNNQLQLIFPPEFISVVDKKAQLVKKSEYFSLPDLQLLQYITDTILVNRGDGVSLWSPPACNDSIYTKDSAIIRATYTTDSVLEKPVYYLKMHPSDGKLAVNVSKNRMAFAYKYYHIIQVMDLDARTVKTIDFKNGNHYYDHEYDKGVYMDAPDPHTTYYCDVFAGEDYFYVLYTGHSYEEYVNSICKKYKWSQAEHKYIKTDVYQQDMPNIVEQYDWNGNPAGRYLLEGETVFRKGRFAVDETNRRFYFLISENCDTFMSVVDCYNQSLIAYSFPANFP